MLLRSLLWVMASPVMAQAALIPVRKIEIVGSTVFPAAELAGLGAALVGQQVTIGQLQALIAQINERYQTRGYITSRAVLNPQTIEGGVVRIDIIEGKLERVDLQRAPQSGRRLQDRYILDRLSIDYNGPLNFLQLEEELQKLRSNPLIGDIKGTLKAGTGEGLSILQLIVTEAPSFLTRLGTDNYGNPNTGSWRANVSLLEQNLTGNGDRLGVNYTRSGRSDTVGGLYSWPVNAQGGTLTLQGSSGVSPIIEGGFNFNLVTESRTVDLTYRQPLFQSGSREFSLSLSLAAEESRILIDQNLIPDGATRSTVVRLGQEYVSRDGGGGWFLRTTVGVGLEGLGATIRSGAPDGRFFMVNGQAMRLQKLSQDGETIGHLRLNFQYGGDALPPLNRFGLGGPFSVRGYRQGLATGDSGIQGTIEVELPLARNSGGESTVKLMPFLDAGTVWNQNGNGENVTLWGVGAGLGWQLSPQINFRFDYGVPLLPTANRGINLQDQGLYFSLTGSF
jgi:hemolysin activation/secretion protein